MTENDTSRSAPLARPSAAPEFDAYSAQDPQRSGVAATMDSPGSDAPARPPGEPEGELDAARLGLSDSADRTVAGILEKEARFTGPSRERRPRHPNAKPNSPWRFWTYPVTAGVLLILAVVALLLPGILLRADSSFSFFLNQAVRGLAGLTLVFGTYIIYQQVQIKRIRASLAEQVKTVEQVNSLAREVYKLAILDTVTGLFNRRYIEQRLAEEISRCLRHGRPLTVILFDLNDFKQVNDRCGHAAGDALLKEFAERLAKATRGSDAAARIGGDEFLALLPECSTDCVPHVLNRLEELSTEFGEHRLRVTFSAGWANYVPGETPEDFLKRADAALYANKHAAKREANQHVALAPGEASSSVV